MLLFDFEETEVKPDVRWFELLVEGISKSKGIAHSLMTFRLINWDIKQEEAKEVIKRFEMIKDVVVDKWNHDSVLYSFNESDFDSDFDSDLDIDLDIILDSDLKTDFIKI